MNNNMEIVKLSKYMTRDELVNSAWHLIALLGYDKVNDLLETTDDKWKKRYLKH